MKLKVPFVDIIRSDSAIEVEIKNAIERIRKTATYIQGPQCIQFEKEFSKYCGKKYGIGVASGTDALTLSLIAHNIHDAEVITTTNTFIATAIAIKNSRNTPVLVDCDKTGNINPKGIEEKITKKTAAIIPVHLYGQPADMDSIITIAQQHNLIIIEDCCQAHGAELKGIKVPINETGCFSFYPSKNLGCYGDGGFIATDSEELYNKLKVIREHGATIKYHHDAENGYNSRLDTFQAAILLEKLKKLDEGNILRRNASATYIQKLENITEIEFPLLNASTTPVHHLFTILTKDRDELRQFLKDEGIDTGIHYPIPVHLQKMFAELGKEKGDFPQAEEFAEKTLSLPLFPGITQEEIKYVCDKIKKFYKDLK